MDCPVTGKKCHRIRCLVLLARRCLLEPDLKAYEQAGQILPSQCQCRQPKQLSANLNAISGSWWSQTESNRRHPACKAGALPTELWPRSKERPTSPGELSVRVVRRSSWQARGLVGPGRLELPTLRLSGVRSNQAELRAYGRTTAGTRPRLAIAHSRSSTVCRTLQSVNEERETETAASRIMLARYQPCGRLERIR